MGKLITDRSAARFLWIARLPAYPIECFPHRFESRLIRVERQFDPLGFEIRRHLAHPRQLHQHPADGVLTRGSTEPSFIDYFQYDCLDGHFTPPDCSRPLLEQAAV